MASDGSTLPCTDSCVKYYINAVLCSTADPNTAMGLFWNLLKESVVSPACFARLALGVEDSKTAVAAIENGLQCSARPTGNLTAEASLDAILTASCGGAAAGALNCTAGCAAALAGFLACADKSSATAADKEAWCYIRSKLGDGCGMFSQIADNMNYAKETCATFTGMGSLTDSSTTQPKKASAMGAMQGLAASLVGAVLALLAIML